MMNKRSTEGYVLAYVLIVVAVMGLIAATLMTSTLQVVKAQENSIEYMKDKYAAMGEIEKLVAEIEIFNSNPSHEGSGNLTEAQKQFYKFINTDILGNTDNSSSISDFSEFYNEITSSNSISTYTFPVSFLFERPLASVEATALITVQIDIDEENIYDNSKTPPEYVRTDYYYNITLLDISFDTYEITSNGGDT